MANIFQKIGSAFGQYGIDNRMPADQFLNLPKGDRRQMQVEGLQKFSEAMNLIGAQQSGDTQRMALIQNQIRQRQVDEENERQKKAIEAFIQTPEGAPYKDMYTLAGSKGVIAMLGRGNNKRRIVQGADGFNYYADTGERVLPNVVANTETSNKTYRGADGYNYWLTGPNANERVNPNIESKTNTLSNPLRTISKDGVDVGAIRDNDLSDEKIAKLYEEGYVIQPLGRTGTAVGKSSDYEGWSDEAGLKTKYLATNQLVRTGQRLMDQLYENPNTVLTIGDLAQAFERVKAETGAIGGRPQDYKKHLDINKLAKIKELAQGSAKTESMLLDFTFQIAKARGQEGRGLSDKDFIIFQKIISAGLTADQKAAALSSFIEGIQLDVAGEIEDEYGYHTRRLDRDPSNKRSLFFKQGIDDLRSGPQLSIVNPFLPGQPQTQVIG